MDYMENDFDRALTNETPEDQQHMIADQKADKERIGKRLKALLDLEEATSRYRVMKMRNVRAPTPALGVMLKYAEREVVEAGLAYAQAAWEERQ